jgi:hypothetical protein
MRELYFFLNRLTGSMVILGLLGVVILGLGLGLGLGIGLGIGLAV